MSPTAIKSQGAVFGRAVHINPARVF